jgi:hypothetical protein
MVEAEDGQWKQEKISEGRKPPVEGGGDLKQVVGTGNKQWGAENGWWCLKTGSV